MGRRRARPRPTLWLPVGAASFVAALLVAWPAQAAAQVLVPGLALPVVLAIILLGVGFDMIGVAATAAEETPFHARAAKRRAGARRGLWLIRNADRVANICSDMVGDLAGTISGAVAVALILRALPWAGHASLVAALGVALVSAGTISLKAVAKAYAIREADRVVWSVGQVLEALDRILAPRGAGARGRRRPAGRRGG